MRTLVLSPRKLLGIVGGVLVAVLFFTIFAKTGQPEMEHQAPSSERLTVEQTVGAALVHYHHGSAHIFKRCNPKAKSYLRSILKDKKLSEFHANTWRILGYVGDESDLRELAKAITKDFSGVLTGQEHKTVLGIFGCLGVMCRRDVKGASALMDKLQDPKYWKTAKFKWYEKQLPGRPTIENESRLNLMIGYALSYKSDVAKRCRSIVEGIADPKERDIMRSALSTDGLSQLASRIQRLEKKVPTHDELRSLSQAFNRHRTQLGLTDKTEGYDTTEVMQESKLHQASLNPATVNEMIINGDGEVVPTLLDWLDRDNLRWPRFRGHSNPLNWVLEASPEESHDGQTEWKASEKSPPVV